MITCIDIPVLEAVLQAAVKAGLGTLITRIKMWRVGVRDHILYIERHI
jgi:hypothetical protein